MFKLLFQEGMNVLNQSLCRICMSSEKRRIRGKKLTHGSGKHTKQTVFSQKFFLVGTISKIPEMGQPKSGVPEMGQPKQGIPEMGQPKSGIPEMGQPKSGIPEMGQPKTGIPEMGQP